MFRAHNEFTIASLRCQNRTLPADGELMRRKLLRVRAGQSEVKMYTGIDALHDEILVAEVRRIEILRSQAALLIPLPGTSETSD